MQRADDIFRFQCAQLDVEQNIMIKLTILLHQGHLSEEVAMLFQTP